MTAIMIYVVNAGMESELIQCLACHDSDMINGRIVSCGACGEYFSDSVLQSEEIEGNTFIACPHCGKDIVEGMTREEYMEGYCCCKYAVIVHLSNGGRRGFMISAEDANDMMRKLAGHINMTAMTAVEFAEIMAEDDVIPG